jgi:hypothetical protein
MIPGSTRARRRISRSSITPSVSNGRSQAILNLFPMPNTTIGGSLYNYTSQISSKYPRREDIVRIDYHSGGQAQIAFQSY